MAIFPTAVIYTFLSFLTEGLNWNQIGRLPTLNFVLFLSFLTEGLNWNHQKSHSGKRAVQVFILPNRGTELKLGFIGKKRSLPTSVFILPNRGTELKPRWSQRRDRSESLFLSFLTEGLNWNVYAPHLLAFANPFLSFLTEGLSWNPLAHGSYPDKSLFLSFLTEGLNWNLHHDSWRQQIVFILPNRGTELKLTSWVVP